MESVQREHRTMMAVNLGLAANVLLSALKTTIGIIGHSPALLADGINSTSDTAYYILVRVFMGLARKPADEEHPYGHRQMESIAALVVGAFVLTTAVAIFWDSVNKVYDLWSGTEDTAGASYWAAVVAVLTVAAKFVLTAVTQRLGRQTGNPTVVALARDHRNDIFAASAATVGIVLGRMGYPWVDPLAGAIVALVILRTGVEILREASSDLMDAVPSRELHARIVEVLAGVPGVVQVEETQAHRFGPYWVVNLTIGVDGAVSLAEGDRIAAEAEHILCREIDLLKRVHVHYHPAEQNVTRHA